MAHVAPSPRAVQQAFQEELTPGQKSALMSWLAFTGTFAGLRLITYSIRSGIGPFGHLKVGRQHLHHYMWGIGLLSGVGGIAAAGSYFAALPVIRRLRRDRRDNKDAAQQAKA